MNIMWLKKLKMKLQKRAFANTVLLFSNRILFELLESDNNDTRESVQKSIGNHCFDVIRKKGSKEILDFRKEMIETVLKIVQSNNPIINMRKELIRVIHSDTLNRTFFSEKFQDRRQELYEALNKYMDKSKIMNCDEATSVIVIWS